MIFVLFLSLWLSPFTVAFGEEAEKEVTTLNPLLAPIVAPVSFIAPGSGHLFKGEKETGYTLLKWHAASFGTFLSAGVLYALSGAADTATPFLTPFLMVGASGWFSLAVADMAGTFVTGAESRKKSPTNLKVSGVYLKDDLFRTSLYSQIKMTQRWSNIEARGSFVTNQRFDDRFYGLGLGYLVLSFQNESSEIWMDLDYEREKNSGGLYRIDLINYTVRAEVPFSVLAPSLGFISTRYSVGFQQYFYKYDSFSNIETNTGLTGGFETTVRPTKEVDLSFGYTHRRQDIVASQSADFTANFFAGGQYFITDHVAVLAKSYVAYGFAYELGVDAQW